MYPLILVRLLQIFFLFFILTNTSVFTLPQPPSPPVSLPTLPCENSTCQSIPTQDEGVRLCRCDEYCSSYGDCCPDAQVPSTPSISEDVRYLINHMDCQSRYRELLPEAVGDAYYMVSSCPSNWTNDTEFANSISFNCSSSSFSEFPPVSDPTTGITYRNEFCAICHRVDTSSTLTWLTRLLCQSSFEMVISETAPENITLDLIRSNCPRCAFDPPNNKTVTDNLRWCLPVQSTCKPFTLVSFQYNETEYEMLVDSCINGDYNPIHQKQSVPFFLSNEAIYRNLDCANCNLAEPFTLECQYLSNSTNDTNSDSRCTNVDGQFILG